VKTLALVLAALTSGAAVAQDVRVAANCSSQLSPLRQRLFTRRANKGPGRCAISSTSGARSGSVAITA
jgi:hypothetical protein